LSERAHWLAPERYQAECLPRDFFEGVNTVASVRTVMKQLSEEETQALLQQVPRIHRTEMNDVLLTALLEATEDWTGQSRLLVDVEGHGREELAGLNVSRTVGWFTILYPVLLQSNRK